MKIILLIYLIVFSTLSAFSQAEFKDGYVATIKGDTIYGSLKMLSETASCAKVYLLNQQGERIKIKTKEITAYKRGEDMYISKPKERPFRIGGGSNGLMRILRTGEIILYEYQYEVTMGSPNQNMAVSSAWKSDFYIERQGELKLVYVRNFKNEMATYFADDPLISERIKEKYYKYEDMEEIVREYNYRTKISEEKIDERK